MGAPVSIAVDIGGTFTDVVVAESGTGVVHSAKVPTTPGRLVDGVREGLQGALEATGRTGADVERFVHGTTVGTNAVLEQKGAVTGLLATEGFEDVLEIGRQKRTKLYDLDMEAETPTFLAPRRRRRGVRERVGAAGEIVTPLDEDQARAQIESLLLEEKIEALAVCFLHSYRNPGHERRVRELAAAIDPDLPVSLSSDVDPTFREYERTVVTAFDAYLRPIVSRYIRELADELRLLGIETPVQIMQSRGGITTASSAERRPVSMLISGPAAGVIGGSDAGARSGFDQVITVDVGGTSADISLVAAGKPLVSTEGKIGGFPLRIPMVDVNTIGAGGGSIAWLDGENAFHVGPISAGSEPGPACYGRGGTEPTVTDASLVLGYLDTDGFAGGSLQLDLDRATAVLERVGRPLGLSSVEAAAGVHRIVNDKMASEIRLVSVSRGYDPRTFTLVCLGGAGPLHGPQLAAELEIPTVIVPAASGVLSAFGLLVSSIEHDRAETVMAPAATESLASASFRETFMRLEEDVRASMKADRVPEGLVEVVRSADMRYVGQAYTLEVPTEQDRDGTEETSVVDRFHKAHEHVYGWSAPSNPVEFVNLKVVGSWALPRPPLSVAPDGGSTKRLSDRCAYFHELGGFVETPILTPSDLAVGEEIEGPAIVQRSDSTLVVYPGHLAALESSGNVRVSVRSRGPSKAPGGGEPT